MFPTTLHALVVVTLCNLYCMVASFLVCSAARTCYSNYNLDCMVVCGGGSGAGGGGGGGRCTAGCCPCSSGTYSY